MDSYSRTLPEVECFELLAVAVVGRIGFVSLAGLQILPVNYRLGAGHRLFFKTAPRGALAQLAGAEAEVAFEVDYHAADFQIAWSVLMNGTISGRLDAVELRCGRGNARYAAVTTEHTWTVPRSLGSCGAYIKGEPGTTFVIYEYPNKS